MLHISKHKALKIFTCVLILAGVAGLKVPVYAAAQCLNGDSPAVTRATEGQLTCPDGSAPCYYGVDDSGTTPHCMLAPNDESTDIPQGDQLDAKCSGTNVSDGIACSKIFTGFIDPLIKFLAVGVGVIVVIVIIIGGIQYATSGGNPQATAAARKRIFGAILALVVFALLYALLNWVVPGGLPTP